MKLNNDVVKKILCDDAVVTMANSISDLARKGQFEPWQLQALTSLDNEYLKKATAIASSDREADQ